MALFIEFVALQWHWFAVLSFLVMLLLWWENRNGPQAITVHQLGPVLNKKDALLIDLRPVKEFREAHIAQALNIPFDKWTDHVGEYAKKDSPVVFVCKYGQQAGGAGKELLKAGIDKEQVYKLKGGMTDWINEQLPTVKGST